MKIGLFDVDNSYRCKVTFPNISLMKLSAWHKRQGDQVEWVEPCGVYDRVYISKVFSDEYTKEVLPMFVANEVIRGGSGYALTVKDGRECYSKDADPPLPYEIEHIFPDYDLYGIHDNAYGFLTRGCPRGCDFCHVAAMQGRKSYTVAELEEFWNGQKYINLCDPNILACKDWHHHFEKLARSRAYVDFNQGLDIRLMTKEKAQALNEIRFKTIHFAWDRPQEDLRDQLSTVREMIPKVKRWNTSVYILCNNGESFEDDVRRVEFVKSVQMQPYVMVYRGTTASKELKALKRYANNPFVCWATESFDQYRAGIRSDRYGKTGIHNKNNSKRME